MSGLGNLSQCMMDGDRGAIGRAKLLRGKALIASLFLETAVIAGMLIWPLVTPGVLPPQFVFTPVPPFHGVRSPNPAPQHDPARPKPDRPIRADVLFHEPPSILRHVNDAADAAPPNIDTGGDPFTGSGLQLWIPGGGDQPGSAEIARPKPDSKPRVVRSSVMDASLIHRVEPDYPKIAKAMRLSGTVLLRARIGTDGEVRELEVVSGNLILAQAALAAVRQWRYQPTRLNGEPVEVETQITVKFVLE
ncbi:MAG TPA: TonB family protein [Candidatus Acidoferrales bacterium]|nr:TonB family protein [Candidatus Acidoferrales bacterium]